MFRFHLCNVAPHNVASPGGLEADRGRGDDAAEEPHGISTAHIFRVEGKEIKRVQMRYGVASVSDGIHVARCQVLGLMYHWY